MAYWGGTYTAVNNRLKDWWKKTSGGNVSDPFLDLINRANRWLWQRAEWDYLTKTYNLSAVLNGLSASLPADFGRVRTNGVYSDTNGDGLPDHYYFLKSSDATKRYKVACTFSVAAGHSWTITFCQSPQSVCYMDYVAVLNDFTGVGTEYTFFPDDLLFRAAQKTLLDERGVSGIDVQTITNALTEQLRDFIKCHQAPNVDRNSVVKDSYGRRVQLESYMSDGSDDQGPSIKTPYNNTTIWP